MQPDSSTGERNEREQSYSPLVRRLADEFGVDLSMVVGTGPSGRVTRADVQQAAFGAGPESDLANRPRPTAPPRRSVPPRETARADREYTVFLDADAGQLLRAHHRLGEDRDQEIPLIALIVRLTVSAFELSPDLDPVGDPVSVLITGHRSDPVLIPGAERLSLIELSERLTTGAISATENPADPNADLVIDDLVATGVRTATPLLPARASAALTIGRPQPVARLIDGQLREVPLLSLAATFNADVVGTSVGARFLAAVASNLEDPILAFAD